MKCICVCVCVLGQDASLRSGRVQSFYSSFRGGVSVKIRTQFERAVTVRLSRRPVLLFRSGVLAYMCLQNKPFLGPR